LARLDAKQELSQDRHAEAPARVLGCKDPRIMRPRSDREACMKAILRVSRFFVVLAVVGCLFMFAAVTVYAVVASSSAIIQFYDAGVALTAIASVTVYAFKILDLYLLGTILYIVALGLAALILESEAVLPRWFKVHELLDLKIILSVGRRRSGGRLSRRRA
jgi:uncharacterized membrane protein YqhA